MGRLESEVREHYPQYADLRYPKPLELKSIRQLLDSDTGLLEFFVGKDGSVLFVVTQEGLASYTLPPARELSGLVRQGEISDRAPVRAQDQQVQETGIQALSLPDWSRCESAGGQASAAHCPGWPLVCISLRSWSLTDETASRGLSYPDLPYLLREHAVSYVPSASVLKGLRGSETREPKRDLPDKAFVAFANPLSSAAQAAPHADAARGPTDPEHRSFPPLLYSEEEVKAIAKLFAGDRFQLYIGDSATKENVLGNPLVERARRVHFATHGFVDEARPERSALVLTPSAGRLDTSLSPRSLT